MHRVALYWLRRDLRLADNPALHYASEHAEQVLFVYIHAPEEEAPWQPGAASRWWLHQSLASLNVELKACGHTLLLKSGKSAPVLQELLRETEATLIVWNRLYEPAIVERDKIIKSELQTGGAEVHSFNAALLVEPWEIQTQQGQPYRVFTPYWRSCAQRLGETATPLPAPRKIKPANRTFPSVSLDSLGLLPEIRWDQELKEHWTPGEAGAHSALRKFIGKRIEQYSTARDFPGTEGTSRLSPFLHFGEIGPRQLIATLRDKNRLDIGAAFVRELIWREFAHHLLFHFPHTTNKPFDPRFERFSWKRNAAFLKAWQRGRTGFPIIDAGMRELWETGYLHNRVRMLVASLLTKNLQIHWLDGARWFWDTLVDADLANNTLGWQWTAGCGVDAAPYFRIFNPETQSARFDAQGSYLRRWVPELTQLADKFIHAPHLASDADLQTAKIRLGRDYPKPLVDLKSTRERALESYGEIKG